MKITQYPNFYVTKCTKLVHLVNNFVLYFFINASLHNLFENTKLAVFDLIYFGDRGN